MDEARRVRGRVREGAAFPLAPPRSEMPRDYVAALGAIEQRIREERLRVVLAANAAVVLLYWDIGRMILDRQERSGWGAKVVDRLAVDLREAFPDMHGFSPPNLKYMRAFAAAWPEQQFVQQPAAQIPWFHNCLLLDRVSDASARAWHIEATIRGGWSRSILALQIDSRAHVRRGTCADRELDCEATIQSSRIVQSEGDGAKDEGGEEETVNGGEPVTLGAAIAGCLPARQTDLRDFGYGS
jgi:predicted nuclease of restriction endonuclease-like (RecB) superfamily